MTTPLKALSGSTPIGFLAALGVLTVTERVCDGREVRLRWTEDIVPYPVVEGVDGIDELIELIEMDRQGWATSAILHSGPDGSAVDDIKPTPDELARWATTIADGLEGSTRAQRRDADQFCALLAEGAEAGKGDSKPTHLHFTAGQQRFLVMVRELAEQVDSEHLREALVGPWMFESKLPMLGWDPRGERIYALRGTNPSNDKRMGVPGADWLGFLGMSMFPVAAAAGKALRTTGFSAAWKRGTFTWPLWRVSLASPTVRSLLGAEVPALPTADRDRRGVSCVYRAPVVRTDQGGYGSFGPSTIVLDASGERATSRAR